MDLTHPDTIEYAVKRWEACKGTRSERGAGDEMAVLLRQLLRQAKVTPAGVEPVLAPETYTAAGLPRRAASRAREHHAVITYRYGVIHAEFPNGSSVAQWVEIRPWGTPAWTKLKRIPGSAPGCTPPEGGNIEEILNNYADSEEGRS